MTLQDLIDAARAAGRDPEELEVETADLKPIRSVLVSPYTLSLSHEPCDREDFEVFDAVVNDGKIVWPE